MTWRQPICDGCWHGLRGKLKPPRVAQPISERCAYCGDPTTSGTYVMADPAALPFPKASDDE